MAGGVARREMDWGGGGSGGKLYFWELNSSSRQFSQ